MASAASRAAALCHGAADVSCAAQAGNLQATALYFQGSYDEALGHYGEALRGFGAVGDTEQRVYVLNNIGSICFVRGRYEEALRAYRDARSAYQEQPRASWYGEARQLTTANHAALLQRLGRYEDALALYEEMTGAASSLPPDEHAQWLTNLGGLLRRLGDPVKAARQYERALTLYDARRNLDARLGTLRNLAIVEALELGQLERAAARFRLILEAAGRAGDARERVQAGLYLAETLWRMGNGRGAALLWREAAGDAARHSLREEHWKALYGLARSARSEGRRREAIELLEKAIGVIEELRGSLRNPALRGDFLGDKRDVYDERIELELEHAPVDAAAVATWVERARERRLQDAPVAGSKVPQGHPPVLMYWLRGDRGARLELRDGRWSVRMLTLPARAGRQFERDFRLWSDAGREQWREGSLRWGRALLAGLEGRRFVVIPDGFLNRMPFEALQPEPGGPLAVERLRLSYAPALAYAFRREETARRGPWARQATALGAPSAGAWLVPGDERRPALPFSRAELESVSRALPGRVTVLAEERATPSRLLEALRSSTVVHVAAHAVADPEDERRSRLLLAADANGRSYVFLEELLALRAPGLELATLSACDTAAGRAVAGEGVGSLGRALLAAGAGSVVSSLWQVDDGATALLMDRFYRELGDGQGRAEALARARLALISRGGPFAHPASWAGFVLHGEGDAPLGAVTSWSQLICGIAALLLLVGLLALRRGGQ